MDNINTITLELQQVFVLVYSGLIFWSLAAMAAGTIVVAIMTAVNNFRNRRRSQ